MARWLIITVGIVILVAATVIALGTAWLNTFIHSEAFRHEVETRAGQTLGGPVRIDAINLSLLGVKLRGVSTQVDSGHVNGQGSLSAKVENVECSYALGDLLRRRLTLTALTLDQPQIVLTRQPANAAPAANAPAQISPASAAPSSGHGAPFQFVLNAAKIRDGSVSIRDATGTVTADLKGISADADTSGYYEGKTISGTLKLADAAFGPNLHLTDFNTPFTFDPHGNFLTAKTFDAGAFGGRLAGDYTSDASGPSILDLNGKGLDLGQLSRAARPASPVRISGSLDFQSKWHGVESGALNGEGDLQLVHGKLEGVRVLQQLGGILRVPELNSPNLQKAETHFQVAGGQTRFTGLILDAGVFRMTGDGVIGQGGAIDANLVLILSQDAMGRLPREIAASFVQQSDGSGSIGFHLTGTTDNPQTDLPERLLLQNSKVQNVISKALKNFFH